MVVVLTVDQRDSRSHADEVPDLLDRLADAPGLVRPFQRTVGDEVQATPQPYGTAFAHADTGQACYLVLEDAWHRELAARVVTP